MKKLLYLYPLLIKMSLFLTCFFLSLNTQAEYYVSYVPPETYVKCESCQVSHVRYHHHRVTHHPVYHRRQSHCQMNVYYIYPPYWIVSPPPCGCAHSRQYSEEYAYPDKSVFFMKPEDRVVANPYRGDGYYDPDFDTSTADNDTQ